MSFSPENLKNEKKFAIIYLNTYEGVDPWKNIYLLQRNLLLCEA